MLKSKILMAGLGGITWDQLSGFAVISREKQGTDVRLETDVEGRRELKTLCCWL